MIEIIKYKCEFCGKEYDTKELAFMHEEKCNKCNNCKHSYFVYGAEFTCEKLNNNTCNKIGFKCYEERTN